MKISLAFVQSHQISASIVRPFVDEEANGLYRGSLGIFVSPDLASFLCQRAPKVRALNETRLSSYAILQIKGLPHRRCENDVFVDAATNGFTEQAHASHRGALQAVIADSMEVNNAVQL